MSDCLANLMGMLYAVHSAQFRTPLREPTQSPPVVRTAPRTAGFSHAATGGAMPRAKVTHQWPDEAVTVAEVYVEPTFADAVDEARVQAVKLWQATCCDVEPEPRYIDEGEDLGEP